MLARAHSLHRPLVWRTRGQREASRSPLERCDALARECTHASARAPVPRHHPEALPTGQQKDVRRSERPGQLGWSAWSGRSG
eukprot:12384347-Alexandrium_andersonii.AAC.1